MSAAYEPVRTALLWHDGSVMIGLLVLLFPFVLLGFMLFMGRVEEPLSQVAVEREMEEFLDTANPEELDTFVREGTESAISRFRLRLGFRRRKRDRASS
jgi:hypothetical protein